MRANMDGGIDPGTVIKSTTVALAVAGFLFGIVVLIGTPAAVGNAFFQMGPARISGSLMALIGVPAMTVLFGLVGTMAGLVLYESIGWLRRHQ